MESLEASTGLIISVVTASRDMIASIVNGNTGIFVCEVTASVGYHDC